MGTFSSKPKASTVSLSNSNRISSIDRTMLDLKNTRDRLYRYRSQLEQEKGRLLQQAQVQKQLGNKTRALGLLRLKNYRQTLLDGVEEQIFTLHQIMTTIDSKQNEQQLLAALKSGKDCLNELHAQFDVDQVLDLMSDVQESLVHEREINDILAQVPELTSEQEEEAQLELDALASEMAAGNTTLLPEVPTHKPLPEAPSSKLPEARPTEPVKSRVAVPG